MRATAAQYRGEDNKGRPFVLNARSTVQRSSAERVVDIRGMTVDYRAPLTPAKNAGGHGHYENQTLDIGIDGGTVGDMKASRGRVLIDHVGQVGTALITLHVDGRLPSVLDYIALPPLNIDARKGGLDPKTVKGTAAADVSISFPTIPLRPSPARRCG